MYSFLATGSRRRDRQVSRLLKIVIFVLVIALAGVTFSYVRIMNVERQTSEAISARAISEASEAQSAVYRLTQSSGANTSTLLATVRSHIYAMQSLNMLASNIYGPGTTVVNSALLDAAISTLNDCDTRLQAGLILTDLYTALRDDVDQIVAAFVGTF